MSNKYSEEEVQTYVAGLISRAKEAQEVINGYTQEQVDNLVSIIAYKMTRPDVEKQLAEFALKDTELGDIPSKIGKIEIKVKGVYSEIKHAKTVGVIEEIPERGLKRIAKPVGVIGALIPSTQPEMIPITTAMMTVKSRNAVVIAPHPRGRYTSELAINMMRDILKENGCPEDILVCCDPDHVTVDVTNEIMKQSDLVIATGGAGMVKAAYSSGTPAYGVGAGNAVMCIDDTADLKDAAHKIMMSKTGDLAAGCSCDNSLIIFDSVYDEMIKALEAEGGYMCKGKEHDKIRSAIFPEWPSNNTINRNIVAKPIDVISKISGISVPKATKFIMAEETGAGFDYPLSGEKMCMTLAVYRVKTLDEAIKLLNNIHAYSGAGHSCGIYSNNQDNILKFALETKTARVNNNLPNSVVNTGNWMAGHPFSPSLGCGTWGGNIASENITLKFYMNNTWLATGIDRKAPTDEELFGDTGVMNN
ncbi:MAG: aldehyde dehydrogenase family protein [Eubacteriaceae bacterium]|jgi:sulfoacetaldehyde dehydrogenase|nr:aldehyde dehydrogenase family protein [Eubacteriaceae bacterium]